MTLICGKVCWVHWDYSALAAGVGQGDGQLHSKIVTGEQACKEQSEYYYNLIRLYIIT
jgi:hypothetical protein